MPNVQREVKPGDVVVVEGHRVGEMRRLGEILAVLGETGHQRYRVRWDDGRETIFYPGSDASVHPAQAPPRRARQRVPERGNR